jgi:tetratricopeptide (TPR) repeat protein
VSAYINMGNCLNQLGRLDEAVEQYHAALKVNPRHANAHYNLGDAYRQQGRRDEARREFELALEYDPSHPSARQAFEEGKTEVDRVEPLDDQNR